MSEYSKVAQLKSPAALRARLAAATAGASIRWKAGTPTATARRRPYAAPLAELRAQRRQADLGRRGGGRAARWPRQSESDAGDAGEPRGPGGAAERTAVAAHRQQFGTTDDLLIGLQLTHSGRFCRPNSKQLEPRIAYHHPLLDAKFGIDPNDDSVVWTDDDLERLIDATSPRPGWPATSASVRRRQSLPRLPAARVLERSRAARPVRRRLRRPHAAACDDHRAGFATSMPDLMVGVRLSVFDIPPYKTSREVGEPMDYTPLAALPVRLRRREDNPLEYDLTEPLQLIGILRIWAWWRSTSPAAVRTTIRTSSGRRSFRPATATSRPKIRWSASFARSTRRGRASRRSRLPMVGTGYTYLQDYLPHVAQAVVRAGWIDLVGIGRMVLSVSRTCRHAKEELPYVGRGESLAPGDVEAAEELLAKYDATVQATLRAAAHGGECRLPHEFSDGILASVDLADRMRRVLAKLMALRGRVAAARGERERAFESILAIWEIGRGLDHQGFGVLLRRVTVEDLASEEVEFLLNEFPLNAEELARLRTKVEAADIQASLLAACYVERAKGYDFFLNFDVDDFEKRSDEDRGVITRGIDCRFFLESYREVVSAVQGPLVQAQVRANKVTEQIESIDRSRDFLAKDERTVTLHFMPGVGPMVACIASRKAYRDTILAAIASRQYEQEHGKLPASLEDLTPKYLPAVPIDSDEKPLRFKPAEEGILIYSVGRNGQDNGGVRVDSWLDSDTVVHLKPTRRRAAEK
jgi:NADPH2 dehydrogenase